VDRYFVAGVDTVRRHFLLRRCAFIAILPSAAFSQVGTVLGLPNSLTPSCTDTYYISQSTGSDAANGKAKATPWKHHPYMSTFTGSYTHHAGDCFIFKGGDDWQQADLGTGLKTLGAGSTADYDYYGVDVTWFSGASWARPKFDAQHSATIQNCIIWISASDGSGNANVTVDSLELAGEPIQASGEEDSIYISQLAHVMINNVNIHDWEVTNTAAGAIDNNYWGGVGDNNPPSLANVVLQNSLIHDEEGCFRATVVGASRTSNVATVTVSSPILSTWISGTPGGNTPKITVNGLSDPTFNMGENFEIAANATSTTFSYSNSGSNVAVFSTGGTVTSACGMAVEFFKTITNNEVHDGGSFQLHGGQTISGNYVHDMFGAFCNCGSTNNTYVDGWDGTSGNATEPAYMYDNRFINANNGTGFWYPNPCTYASGVVTRTMYAFDNLAVWISGHTSNYAIDIDPAAGSPTTTCASGSTVNIYTYNNTIVLDPSDDTACGRIGHRTGTGEITNVYNVNNFCVHTSGMDWNYNGSDLQNTSTPVTSLTITNAQAATAGYLLTPPNYSLTSSTCNGNPAFCTVRAGTDLTASCSGLPLLPYLCEDIAGVTRPASGPWDVGAFNNTPAPPTNLVVTVH
jgi:hypothetical protein